ncbi:hypothetical protein H7T43_09150 [Peribacillus simplex]|uniref:hypothetical protein n=1 Tax=Peribacillus simplex TaxID=1478 RepID=UPI002989E119|nr:hypothetical protein [Peribacillus simplex]MBX9955083.1 hypothetical protein [Peribacillus simplex]
MYQYEKEIAQLERKKPMITYKLEMYPLTKYGVLAFSIAKANKDKKINAEIVFYYNDPHETEAERQKIVAESIDSILANHGVAGFARSSSSFHSTTYLQVFDFSFGFGTTGGKHNEIKHKEDWDWKIVERIEHDYSNEFTLEDIKAL